MSVNEADGGHGRVLEAVLATVRELVVVLDDRLRVIGHSASFPTAFRLDPDSVRGSAFFSVGGGLFDLRPLRQLLERDLEEGGRAEVIVSRAERTSGPRTLLVNASRFGARGSVVVAMQDATDVRRSESELAASRQRFELFVENVREYAIFAMDEAGQITLWNPGAERILGWTEEEALGQPGHIIFTEEDRAAGVPDKEIATAAREGQALDDRWQIRKDGARFWASGVTTALKDGDAIYGFVKILRDNTRRKQSETELEDSHRWLRRILEVTPDVVALYDLKEDRIGFVSPHLIANLGYARDDFYTLDRESIGKILHPDDRARGAQVRRDLLDDGSNEPHELALRVFDADGRVRWYHARVVPFRRSGGRTREVLVVARDYTDMHETQEALHRLTATLERRVEERTTQVRALASTLTMAEQQERRRISQVLHDDVQQRLYGIQMKMASIRRGAESAGAERLIHDAREAEQWLRDTIDMTRDLTVSLSPPVLQGEGLADALQWLIVQMQRLHGLRVTLEAQHSFYIPDDDMRELLFQIVRELLFNVVKHAGVNEANVSLAEGEEFLTITVSDRGAGFVDRTKGAGADHHEAFGLFSVRERLKLFGGGIDVTTAPGEGTTVEVRVPRGLVS